MQASQTAINLIKKFEGIELNTYICPAGYPTIGYGHRIRSDEKISNSITEEYAEKLLYGDLEKVENCINSKVNTELNQNQFDALVSFVYNLGCGTFSRSSVLKYINSEKHEKVPNAIRLYNKSNGTILNGLTKRREEEALLYEQ